MIITKLAGGLGNQMFQYAAARTISQHNSDRVLLDISFFETQKLRDFDLAHMNISSEIATECQIADLAGKTRVLDKILRKIGLSQRPLSYYREMDRTVFDTQIYRYQDNIYLDGYWQNVDYFESIRDVLISEFTLKNGLCDIASQVAKEIIERNGVSVHVRRGDYLTKKNRNIHGLCTIDYYTAAAEYLREKVGSCPYFIFTDDANWCEENLGFLGDDVSIVKGCSAAEDLILMSLCSHNIIANSSFSWWAAWLNENKEKIVIAPKEWVVSNSKKHKWACHDWVEI
jgi:hypothetical protein